MLSRLAVEGRWPRGASPPHQPRRLRKVQKTSCRSLEPQAVRGRLTSRLAHSHRLPPITRQLQPPRQQQPLPGRQLSSTTSSGKMSELRPADLPIRRSSRGPSPHVRGSASLVDGADRGADVLPHLREGRSLMLLCGAHDDSSSPHLWGQSAGWSSSHQPGPFSPSSARVVVPNVRSRSVRVAGRAHFIGPGGELAGSVPQAGLGLLSSPYAREVSACRYVRAPWPSTPHGRPETVAPVRLPLPCPSVPARSAQPGRAFGLRHRNTKWSGAQRRRDGSGTAADAVARVRAAPWPAAAHSTLTIMMAWRAGPVCSGEDIEATGYLGLCSGVTS